MLLIIISSAIILYSLVIYIAWKKQCRTEDSKIYQDRKFFKSIK